VLGNHDIETGHDILNQFVSDCNFPILAANALDEQTGEPHFEPYELFVRGGVRIAVIGFVTPAIPHWVPKRMWQGLRFEKIEECAQRWVDHVRQFAHADLVVAVLHSGLDEGIVTPDYRENATRMTVEQTRGLDLVLYGHDHHPNMVEITDPDGRGVMCVNPGCYAYNVAQVRIDMEPKAGGGWQMADIDAQLRYIGKIRNTHSVEFGRHFQKEFREVNGYVSQQIGEFLSGVDITDAYFGSSAYIDFIQQLQLHVSKADITFAAPLFFTASVEAGPVCVSDLFNLYRFEDRLYTLRLKGSEIKAYLEMSYANWANQMTSADDHLMLLSPMKSNPERLGFTNFIFNFDSAAGIRYEVDVRKEAGQRVNILSLSDGRPFSPDAEYTVAMTAYRANGGGELLTKGAGLSKEEIERRIIAYTDRDIRYYLFEYIREQGQVRPQALHQWQFVPAEWAQAAAERERKMLFHKDAGTADTDIETLDADAETADADAERQA